MTEDTAGMFGFLAVLAVLKGTALSWMRKQKQYVGKVSELYVYPVKSVRELKPDLQAATLTKLGMAVGKVADRHWMVTKDNDMWTIRQNTRLTLITSRIQDNNLRLDGPDMQPLLLPLDPEIRQENMTMVTVKMTPLPAVDLGDDAAAWICKVLQEDGLRLNFSAPSFTKRCSNTVQKGWKTEIQPHDEVAFQDFVPCMIMCQSSLDALNNRLDNPVTCINFRPNIMLEGTQPFDEDNWQELYIGDQVHVRYVDKCTRCTVVTVDPDTAVKDKNEQPMAELRKFRCMEPYGPKPCMGIHTAVNQEGQVKIGDDVYVVRRK